MANKRSRSDSTKDNEIKQLKKQLEEYRQEAKEWKAFYFEALSKLSKERNTHHI